VRSGKTKDEEEAMKFPVKENRNGKCLACGHDMNSKFVVFTSGCMRVINKKDATAFGKNEAELLMSLSTHNHEVRDVSLDIVDPKSVKRGQVDLYFCSFNCARDFFVIAVNTLETKYERANKVRKHLSQLH
jgi:hypothetical protein